MVVSLYKLVAKMLATRLRVVMDKLISPNRLTFLKGGLFVDCAVDMNEVIDLSTTSINSFLIFKVNFDNAYHSIIWKFMDYTLIIFRFYVKWGSSCWCKP